MTTFVILAAGYGSRIGRVGEHLHKALVPLGDRAIISHLLDLAPSGARIIVCVGYRGEQVREYLNLAHPQRKITFVSVDLEGSPHGVGPGASLLAAREEIGDDDLVVTCCDTVWERDVSLWRNDDVSWLGVAPVPAGTDPERWCRVREDDVTRGLVYDIVDKGPGLGDLTWVGLASVTRADLADFWCGLAVGDVTSGERQLSSGFTRLLDEGRVMEARHVNWTDVGDETAYQRAVARVSGYDWVKPGRATYVLPDQGQVVKFAGDEQLTAWRAARGLVLTSATPPGQSHGRWMFAYDYVPGIDVYDAIEQRGFTVLYELLEWWRAHFTASAEPVDTTPGSAADSHVRGFYRDKTHRRVSQLSTRLRVPAMDVMNRVDWGSLVPGTVLGRSHGDLTFANVVMTRGRTFYGIDWREHFDGTTEQARGRENQLFGDLRYDLAKLLTSAVVHWGNATRGDFRRWRLGETALGAMRGEFPAMGFDIREIEIIAALCLLNSAPLHAAPFDAVLVARGCAWLEEVL